MYSLQVFDNWLLELLGKHFAFEIIIGANGRFILNAAKPADVIRIANIILSSETRDRRWINDRIKEMIRSN